MNALADMGFARVLADEMGLGKSIQFISFAASRASTRIKSTASRAHRMPRIARVQLGRRVRPLRSFG